MRAAAQTFRANPELDTESAITALGVGEALVSVLDAKGTPSIVQRVLIRPPDSQMGPIDDAERAALIKASPLAGAYDELDDRESAYEILQARADKALSEAKPVVKTQSQARNKRGGAADKSIGQELADMFSAFGRSAMRSVGTQAGRAIVRGILGSLRSR